MRHSHFFTTEVYVQDNAFLKDRYCRRWLLSPCAYNSLIIYVYPPKKERLYSWVSLSKVTLLNCTNCAFSDARAATEVANPIYGLKLLLSDNRISYKGFIYTANSISLLAKH